MFTTVFNWCRISLAHPQFISQPGKPPHLKCLKSHQVTLVVAGPGGFQGLAKRQLFETFQGTWENSPMGICRDPQGSPGVPLQCEGTQNGGLAVQFHYGLWTFYDYSYWGLF